MIRAATPADVPVIADLIRALAEYEKLAHLVTLDEKRLHEHLFGTPRFAEVILAEAKSTPRTGEPGASAAGVRTSGASVAKPPTIAGFALFFHNYSTFHCQPGIYLEDLFVRPEHRGQGHGRALLAELARLAIERGCGRLEWVVLHWNELALRFYRSLGAKPMDEWATCRLTGDDLERLAKTPVPTDQAAHPEK
jgi:GNAT superfamily N-acetyltransferase